jgi:hypothetical protein
VPEDLSGPWRENTAGMIHREILDAICVEMNFALVCTRKTIEQLGEGTLRAMTAVDERRNNSEAQVSASTFGDYRDKD